MGSKGQPPRRRISLPAAMASRAAPFRATSHSARSLSGPGGKEEIAAVDIFHEGWRAACLTLKDSQGVLRGGLVLLPCLFGRLFLDFKSLGFFSGLALSFEEVAFA